MKFWNILTSKAKFRQKLEEIKKKIAQLKLDIIIELLYLIKSIKKKENIILGISVSTLSLYLFSGCIITKITKTGELVYIFVSLITVLSILRIIERNISESFRTDLPIEFINYLRKYGTRSIRKSINNFKIKITNFPHSRGKDRFIEEEAEEIVSMDIAYSLAKKNAFQISLLIIWIVTIFGTLSFILEKCYDYNFYSDVSLSQESPLRFLWHLIKNYQYIISNETIGTPINLIGYILLLIEISLTVILIIFFIPIFINCIADFREKCNNKQFVLDALNDYTRNF